MSGIAETPGEQLHGEEKTLAGRTLFITGGSRGIGLAIALRAARDGANIAIALAKRYVDGDGNFTGTFVVNEPTAGSTTGGRSLVTGTQAGTVSVNCDGTGVVTRILTVAGAETTQMDDFVITEAKFKDGELIATTIVDAQRTSSAIVSGGVFLRRTWTRVP